MLLHFFIGTAGSGSYHFSAGKGNKKSYDKRGNNYRGIYCSEEKACRSGKQRNDERLHCHWQLYCYHAVDRKHVVVKYVFQIFRPGFYIGKPCGNQSLFSFYGEVFYISAAEAAQKIVPQHFYKGLHKKVNGENN